ncbi:MAG: cell division protease FtsH [Gaiellaceae bacterium]|jgi:cell division protease FtsH|nr:cell division protease FtsH [Gaiellaceae bacterium]
MRVGAPPVAAGASTTTTSTNSVITIQDGTIVHHSLVGQWFHDVVNAVTAGLPIFFVVLLAITAWLLWRMVGAMPRTKPQNMATKGVSTTTWDDVAGVEEVRAELEEVVEFFRDPERFERLGAKVPKGLLLYGPPGTGKTLLARAVAHESGANFYSASAASFVEMFAGLGAARIRKLFQEARKNAPAIIFIDELDAVGAQRSGHGFNREQDQTLNQLLVELDGFEGAEQVVVMGASNRIEDLDTALLRPGRFDRQMLVPPPDLAGREAILRVHTRGKPLGPDVSLATVARQTSGLTGAELANVCNEAAIAAGRRGDVVLTQEDFDGALERVVAGLQQKKVLTEKERMILAYHEGGHALMAHLMGGASELQKVTIVARGTALGYTFHLPEEDRYLHTKEELIDWMVVALAGRAAEEVVFGRVTNGAANDLEKVTDIARHMVFDWGMSDAVSSRTMRADNYALSEATKRVRDDEQSRLTDGAYAESIRLLTKHRAPLDRVAAALLDKETLGRDEVLELFHDVEPESRASETVGVPRIVATTYGSLWP